MVVGVRIAAVIGLLGVVQAQLAGRTFGNSTRAPNTVRPTSRDCQLDNCLRQFQQSTAVSAFCATYTASLNTASTGLPKYVAQCTSTVTDDHSYFDPSRISSACSCVVTGTPSTTTPSSSSSSSQWGCEPTTVTVTTTEVSTETCTVTVTAPGQEYTTTQK